MRSPTNGPKLLVVRCPKAPTAASRDAAVASRRDSPLARENSAVASRHWRLRKWERVHSLPLSAPRAVTSFAPRPQPCHPRRCAPCRRRMRAAPRVHRNPLTTARPAVCSPHHRRAPHRRPRRRRPRHPSWATRARRSAAPAQVRCAPGGARERHPPLHQRARGVPPPPPPRRAARPPPSPRRRRRALPTARARAETKKPRDACVISKGEEFCRDEIEAHKACLRADGFDVR